MVGSEVAVKQGSVYFISMCQVTVGGIMVWETVCGTSVALLNATAYLCIVAGNVDPFTDTVYPSTFIRSVH